MFYVHDENIRLLVVGAFVMTRQNQQNYKAVFDFFYECVCDRRDIVENFVVDSLPFVMDALS